MQARQQVLRRIGEDPHCISNNLFPFNTQVFVGRRPDIIKYGEFEQMQDRTRVLDYIHVMDLTEGPREALHSLLIAYPHMITPNLGSRQGASVLDVVKAMEAASQRAIPYLIAPRRTSDAAITVANPNGYGEACL